MTLPPEEGRNSHRTLPLWVKVGSFGVTVAFLLLLVLVLNHSQLKVLKVGEPVPDFTLVTFGGSKVQLSSLRGQTVLVNLWASWCVECQEEAQSLETVWQEVQAAHTAVFLGIDYADTEKAALQFIQENGVTYSNGPDLQAKISSLFHITGVPETYLIDAAGNLAAIKIGPFSSLDEIRAFLQQK